MEVKDYFRPPEDLLWRVQAVINLAGATSGEMEEANVTGPLRLAKLAKACGVRQFVQLSSFSIYGHAERICGDTPEAPVTDYGRSKQRADAGLQELQSDGFAVTLLRVPMLYGNGAGDKILKLANAMISTGFWPVPKTPRCRSFLHVDNLAALAGTLLRKPVAGACFGADADSFTVELLAEVIAEVKGKKLRLVRLPDPAFLPLRLAARGLYVRLYQSCYMDQRAGVKPDTPLPVLLREGLADMLSAQQGNR